MVDKDGVTLRETLEGLAGRTRRPHKRLEYEAQLALPPFPVALGYLWAIYRRLRRRKGGGFGPSPIEWPDIDAFLRHARISLAPWEVEVIEEIDDLFLIANQPKSASSPPSQEQS